MVGVLVMAAITNPHDYTSQMSIRELFAMEAMNAILSGNDIEKYQVNGGYTNFNHIAEESVQQADALINALNK